jgi:hypothetical protein
VGLAVIVAFARRLGETVAVVALLSAPVFVDVEVLGHRCLPTFLAVASGADAPRRMGAGVGECGRETATLSSGVQIGRHHEAECEAPDPDREET